MKNAIKEYIHDPFIRILIWCVVIALVFGILLSDLECIQTGIAYVVCIIIIFIIQFKIGRGNKIK